MDMRERLSDYYQRGQYYGWATDCHAGGDGDCYWSECPQLRDDEPKKSGRHCPLDNRSDDY